eukprot:m.12849 g.12849  ORF g.12849 m.12849 type:complete len:580 (-) comp9968_c0_seq1:118-1857(-)
MEESTNRIRDEQDQHIHEFKGVEYVLQLDCNTQSGGSMRLVVEERFTCESWMGVFEPTYIEELTRRTGNYKPFGVFTAMLQAALAGTNPAVKIDLLTYGDLETLRQRKLANNSVVGQAHHGGPAAGGPSHAKFTNKRYLIMTFTSEFDRVHYPLPLEHQGEPHAGRLQDIIRTLSQDLAEAREGQRQTAAALVELQRTHKHVCSERDALRQAAGDSASGGDAAGPARDVLTARQEAAVLKKVIAKLETDLLSERSKFQKALQKKTEQLRDLAAEADVLRDAERSLQARCRSLAGETSLRRARQTSLRGASGSRRRSESAERRQAAPRPRKTGTPTRVGEARGRHASGERAGRGRHRSPATAQLSSAERLSRGERASVRLRGRAFSRSPSPGRFDPTEYVRAREEKLQAVRAAREADRRRARSASPRPRSHEPRPRAGSGSRRTPRLRAPRVPSTSPPRRTTATSPPSPRGQGLAASAFSSSHPYPATSPPSQRRAAAAAAFSSSHPSMATTAPSPNGNGLTRPPQHTSANQTAAATGERPEAPPPADHQSYFKRNAEITDIDARLQALQDFLKSAHGAP